MAKESRNRESSSSSKGSICMKMSTCELSWRGSNKCAKNCCRSYKDPRDPKNNKK